MAFLCPMGDSAWTNPPTDHTPECTEVVSLGLIVLPLLDHLCGSFMWLCVSNTSVFCFKKTFFFRLLAYRCNDVTPIWFSGGEIQISVCMNVGDGWCYNIDMSQVNMPPSWPMNLFMDIVLVQVLVIDKISYTTNECIADYFRDKSWLLPHND